MQKSRTNSLRRLLTPLVLSVSLLSGCAGTASSSCPPLVEYSDSFNVALIDAMEALPEDSVFITAIGDYRTLRRQVEVCRD